MLTKYQEHLFAFCVLFVGSVLGYFKRVSDGDTPVHALRLFLEICTSWFLAWMVFLVLIGMGFSQALSVGAAGYAAYRGTEWAKHVFDTALDRLGRSKS